MYTFIIIIYIYILIKYNNRIYVFVSVCITSNLLLLLFYFFIIYTQNTDIDKRKQSGLSAKHTKYRRLSAVFDRCAGVEQPVTVLPQLTQYHCSVTVRRLQQTLGIGTQRWKRICRLAALMYRYQDAGNFKP